jgi:hypothetical protein
MHFCDTTSLAIKERGEMISAVYFINLKGEIVIYRSYRDDVR